MLTSRLEHYIYIAKLLLESRPKTFNEISALIGNLNYDSLKQDLNFLSSIGVIKENTRDETYSIADSGIGVLHFFRITPSKETIEMNR
jgi:hypothetical protein